jgi:cellulose biosynthesis protein BcsQ
VVANARTIKPSDIALASQKGGAGKTTLVLELAAVFADTSDRALVVDIDPQRTAEEIITASDDVTFDFAAEDDPRVLERLQTVRDYDAIIVDCPGQPGGHGDAGRRARGRARQRGRGQGRRAAVAFEAKGGGGASAAAPASAVSDEKEPSRCGGCSR